MKILSTERRIKIENGQVVNTENPAYLYELLQSGAVGQRHGMVMSTILNELTKHEVPVNGATPMEGLSFHNLCISTMGPYILNAVGEQVYTFRNDHTMVKLDPGTQHADIGHYVSFPKGIYSCCSYDVGGAVRSVEYLAILNSGVIRFQYKQTAGSLRMSVLSNKELPENVTKHLLHIPVEPKVGAQETVEQKSNNNPAIGFKLLLGLLDEVETNGNTTSS